MGVQTQSHQQRVSATLCTLDQRGNEKLIVTNIRVSQLKNHLIYHLPIMLFYGFAERVRYFYVKSPKSI